MQAPTATPMQAPAATPMQVPAVTPTQAAPSMLTSQEAAPTTTTASQQTPELGRVHTTFEFGRAWGKEWAVCVGKFLNCKSQVTGWLLRGQKWTMPPALGTKIETQQTKELWVGVWWKWWESLQPEEHKIQDNNELSCPREVNWSEMVGLYGNNGILQVMATLVWWGEVAHKCGKAEIEGWRAAVDDVTWVLKRLLESKDVGRTDEPLQQRKRKGHTATEK
ncbi:hypothetical protein DFH08DRAFT_977680 [Mycena albidolilacea]|uniref:Uncharacterized protein n=1 Tax=Mycena albidolilacea TaxID=1033008 RepID=A0AAD6Z0E5_9AGAR|nr:hypothetical protein DFH08DRAFT_977680 [Mycena albidolilacea]